MSSRAHPAIILVANNPFGHHLLTSQLLGIYQDLDLGVEIILLCNGKMANAETDSDGPIKVISFAASLGGVFSYLKLIFNLIRLRIKYPDATYHLRGFVAGSLFFLSRIFLLQKARYIYDPRGAFFIEWREKGRSRAISRFFGWCELHLIRNSIATIVTSNRFARLYRRLFGSESKYVPIYNSTSFEFVACRDKFLPDGNFRVVYLGTFNYWHDMEEIARVMASVASQIGAARTEITIYTTHKFHKKARELFGCIDCASLVVDYVSYHDIPEALADKHIGVSVVRPTLSTSIASPIKISDYIALGLVPLLNRGIGDFDEYFAKENSAILYRYGEAVDVSEMAKIRNTPNKLIYDSVSREQALYKIRPIVESLLHG